MLFDWQMMCLEYLAVYINFVIATDAVDAETNGSVALHRPTFMVSVWDDPALGGLFSASKAVDGNKDPVAMKPDNSCCHTQMETNPWWAMDLGAAFAVVAILFTNRADNLGNVLFMVSSSSP